MAGLYLAMVIYIAMHCRVKPFTLKQQSILNFWRDVEIFNLPDFNNEASLLESHVMLPWEQQHSLRNPQNNMWRYSLLFGRIDKKQIIDTIEALLETPDKHADWEEPVTGDTCLSALVLDQYGQPDKKSYVPAAFVFGIHCLKNELSVANVPTMLNGAQSDFELRYNIVPDVDETSEQPHAKGDTVTRRHLQKEIEYLQGKIKDWNKAPIEIFVVAKEVPKDSEPDIGFLNSFYLEDLNMLLTQKTHAYGSALQQYLSSDIDDTLRKDLIADKTLLLQSIDPELVPAGRWPSNVAYGLYTAQAGAVNTVLTDLKDTGGIRGINGPPGTGKTTLLLDVIANVVVARATRLLNSKASQIFGRYHKIEKENGYSGYYNIVADEINDSGIVVASNNNTAVENITRELPALKKIDVDEFQTADYFSECARRLIKGKNGSYEKSWGILSAALGNAANKNDFKWSFWIGNEHEGCIGFNDVLRNVYKDENNSQSNDYEQQFEAAKKELKTLLQEFDIFRYNAADFHRQYTAVIRNIAGKHELENKLRESDLCKAKLFRDKEKNNEQLQQADEMVNLAQVSLQAVNTRKPSFLFFRKVFNTVRYREWKTEHDKYQSVLQAAADRKRTVIEEKNLLLKEIERLATDHMEMSDKLRQHTVAIEQYSKRRDELHTKYGIAYKNMADDRFYQLPLEEIHKSTPYSSALINKLRSTIFLKSLELHKYCILANAKQFRNNLNVFFEMLEGKAKVDEDLAKTLWDTFFFCVPVISTTLASVSRLFPSMGKESIGWLLLDEAGQATPQSAAGIIWRSKRCIIVGDPLQIEPVVTVPSRLIFKLRTQEQVEEIWSPDNTSVQVLADRISIKGTYMNTGESDEKIWTGFPLRTHRRCNDPMFSIANQIAYCSQMVKATEDDDFPDIGASTWYHIINKTSPVNKHVLPEELELLQEKISTLRSHGYKGSIFVISPFKSVADVCRTKFRVYEQVSCGTIHTFQGKEADIVFLVLGGNPASPGARAWASRKPNMLNVALTRAKKRFYVIGNINLWGQCNYFNIMARQLQNR